MKVPQVQIEEVVKQVAVQSEVEEEVQVIQLSSCLLSSQTLVLQQ